MSRPTGPISIGVTGTRGPLHKYPNRALPLQLTVPGPLSCSTLSFHLFFVTIFPCSILFPPSLPCPVIGVSRLTYFNIWRGGPPAWWTIRSTWQVPGRQAVQSAHGYNNMLRLNGQTLLTVKHRLSLERCTVASSRPISCRRTRPFKVAGSARRWQYPNATPRSTTVQYFVL